jgi:hypothetical protein
MYRDEYRVEKIMRFALIAGLLTAATSSAIGQTTNVVQPAYFVLKGTTQTASGGVKSVRVVNKDILAALNETGAYQFEARAALLFVSTDDEQLPVLMVRNVSGSQVTTNDIGDFFGITEIGDEVRSPDDSIRWQTWNFAFDNNTTNETAFQLWGATTIERGTVHAGRNGEGAGSPAFVSDVRGVGRVQGAVTVFSGTVSSGNAALVREER